MNINRRLEKLENSYSPATHRPLVISWIDGKPQFRNKPKSKAEAIDWLAKRAWDANMTDAKDLVMHTGTATVPAIEDYIIEKFNINTDQL